MKQHFLKPDPIPRPDSLKGKLSENEEQFCREVESSDEYISLQIHCGKKISPELFTPDDIHLMGKILQHDTIKECALFISGDQSQYTKDELDIILFQFKSLLKIALTSRSIDTIYIIEPLLEALKNLLSNESNFKKIILLKPTHERKVEWKPTENPLIQVGIDLGPMAYFEQKNISSLLYKRMNTTESDKKVSSWYGTCRDNGVNTNSPGLFNTNNLKDKPNPNPRKPENISVGFRI